MHAQLARTSKNVQTLTELNTADNRKTLQLQIKKYEKAEMMITKLTVILKEYTVDAYIQNGWWPIYQHTKMEMEILQSSVQK